MNEELSFVRIDDDISYIIPATNPLSANVVIIKGNEALWLFDVGSHPKIPDIIKRINVEDKPLNVILSHFHMDHIANITNIKYNNLYQGRYTYKHTNAGIIVENDINIEDGNISLHIFVLPSSHSKGAIGLEVNEKYCFLGDGVYARNKKDSRLYNVSLLKEQIDLLKTIKSDNFMLSHKTPFAMPKEAVIGWLESIYSKRKKNESYISM